MIPKTTLNTIVKELERDGYVKMEIISGRRREMNIYLTEAGKKYARQVLDSFYQAEEEAFRQIKNAKLLSDELEDFCRKLGEAFAALNLIFPLIMVLGAVGFMIGSGSSAIIGIMNIIVATTRKK